MYLQPHQDPRSHMEAASKEVLSARLASVNGAMRALIPPPVNADMYLSGAPVSCYAWPEEERDGPMARHLVPSLYSTPRPALPQGTMPRAQYLQAVDTKWRQIGLYREMIEKATQARAAVAAIDPNARPLAAMDAELAGHMNKLVEARRTLDAFLTHTVPIAAEAFQQQMAMLLEERTALLMQLRCME